jgi:hypothetical protein
MAITITEDFMTLEIDGRPAVTAVRQPGGRWQVTDWPGCYDRDQAITALTITELLQGGYPADHPLVSALREELR